MVLPYSAHPFVVIPAHNEEVSLPQVLAPLLQQRYRVVVVDDASTDNTFQIAKKAGAVVLRLPVRLGAWGATQTGLRFCLEKGAELLVCMDGDAQHSSKHIPLLLHKHKCCGADLVIASDPMRGGGLKRFTRKVLQGLSRTSVNDITSGFKVLNRRVATLLVEEKMSLLDYQDVGPLCLIKSSGLVIKEVPVTFYSRRHGTSRVFDCFLSLADYMLQSLVLTVGSFLFRSRVREEQ